MCTGFHILQMDIEHVPRQSSVFRKRFQYSLYSLVILIISRQELLILSTWFELLCGP